MALNNCTINDASFAVTKDTQLGGGVSNKVLTITPDHGYVLAAANFANNTGTHAAIQSIALADSGTAYADNNTVTVTIDMKDTYVAAANLDIVIDIDGDATDKKNTPTTLSGVYNTTVTNATPASQSNVAYTTTQTPGTEVTLFTKTFTADTAAPGSAITNLTTVDYVFSQNTTDSDPGVGGIKFNHGSIGNPGSGSVTKIWIDDSAVGPVNKENEYQTLKNNPAAVKGYIKIAINGSTTQYKQYKISAVTDKTGYWEFTVHPTEHTGTLSPLGIYPGNSTVDVTLYHSSGYFFDPDVYYNFTAGDENNYNITAVKTVDSSNRLLSKTFTVKGTTQNVDDTSDVLNFTAKAIEIPTNINLNEITSYTTNTTPAPLTRSKRALTVYGNISATYKLTVVRSSDSQTYDFTAGDFTSTATDSGTLTIGSNGSNSTLFTFPAVVSNDTYTVTIAGVGSTVINTGTYTNPFTYTRVGMTSITVSANSAASRSYTGNTVTYTNYAGTAATIASGNPPLSGQPNVEIEQDETGEFNFRILLTDNVNIVKSRDPIDSDWTLTNISDLNVNHLDLSHGTMAIQGNNSQSFAINGTGYRVNEFGTSNATMQLNLDNFIQTETGGGPGGGGSGLGVSHYFQHNATGYGWQVFYPMNYTITHSNLATGSSRSHAVSITGLIIGIDDLPDYVDNVGDIFADIEINDSSSTDAYDSSDVTAGNVTIGGSIVGFGSNAYANITVSFTITGSSGTVANGDTLSYIVKFSFANISQ